MSRATDGRRVLPFDDVTARALPPVIVAVPEPTVPVWRR